MNVPNDNCHSVHQPVALHGVPEDIAKMIAGNANIRSFGINVFFRLDEGLPGNYFIVAIPGNENPGNRPRLLGQN